MSKRKPHNLQRHADLKLRREPGHRHQHHEHLVASCGWRSGL